MSDEEIYESDVDVNEEPAVEGNQADNDYEVELSSRAPKGDVFLQIFPRTKHWLHDGVRPEEIIREDKEEMVFAFVKRMKDPLFPAEEGVRYIRFRGNLVISELEIEMTFTHIELFYEDENGNIGQGCALLDGDEECPEVKKVFQKVIDNLASYLIKE